MGLSGTSSYAVFVYLCICVFVFVYLCMRHLVISVLISLDQELSENVWFLWSKTSYSGYVTDAVGTKERRRPTRKDRATQPLDAGRLSFAIFNGKQRRKYIDGDE